MPRLLNLFCGAGGDSVGYDRAGFDVVGVDIAPQPHYPFEFVQADALEVLRAAIDGTWQWDAQWLDQFAAIHASPPCQFATAYRRVGNVKPSPNLIGPTRELLELTGLPYVIENVETAAEYLRDPLKLCGSQFDLDVQRHRLFETNWRVDPPAWPCRHRIWAPDRFPGGRSKERTGSSRGLVRACVEIGSWDTALEVQQRAMGVDWMTLEELSQAIPPAYTEFIGGQLLEHVRAKAGPQETAAR